MTHHDKRYHIKAACPQCGCSFAQVLSAEELKKKNTGICPMWNLNVASACLNFRRKQKKSARNGIRNAG